MSEVTLYCRPLGRCVSLVSSYPCCEQPIASTVVRPRTRLLWGCTTRWHEKANRGCTRRPGARPQEVRRIERLVERVGDRLRSVNGFNSIPKNQERLTGTISARDVEGLFVLGGAVLGWWSQSAHGGGETKSEDPVASLCVRGFVILVSSRVRG